jgi:polyhydroxyalkanoate synthase
LDNNLSQDRMKLAGKSLSLKDVTIPIYNLATREDHIAPAKSVFHGTAKFGGDVVFVLAGSGHIAGVINPPAAGKYQFYTDGEAKGSYEDWLARAVETPGSWWPHWDQWIRKQSDKKVPARRIGAPGFEPIEDAPGSYVKVKV